MRDSSGKHRGYAWSIWQERDRAQLQIEGSGGEHTLSDEDFEQAVEDGYLDFRRGGVPAYIDHLIDIGVLKDNSFSEDAIDALVKEIETLQQEYNFGRDEPGYWSFNIKVGKLDIPEQVYEVVPDGVIDKELAFYADALISAMPRILQDEIVDLQAPLEVMQTGRSGGWLAIKDWTDLESIKEDLLRFHEMSSADVTAGIDYAMETLAFVEKHINDTREAYESDVSSLEWWDSALEEYK